MARPTQETENLADLSTVRETGLPASGHLVRSITRWLTILAIEGLERVYRSIVLASTGTPTCKTVHIQKLPMSEMS